MNPYFSYLIGEILQPLSDNYQSQISINEVLMTGQLYLNKMFQCPVTAQLTSQQLTIKDTQGNILSAKIEFSLKFVIILQNDNNIRSKKKGFKLIKDGSNQSISFYFINQSLSKIWIDTLKRYINQLGFHQRFKAIRKLGKGQFATVFEVESIQTSEKFAVKAFSKNALLQNLSEKKMENLINQIKIMRSFRHHNLLKLEGVFQSDNSIYLVIELLRGGSLIQRIQKLVRQQKSLVLDNTKQIMMGILNGLTKLNEVRIAHRDIKLENIVLRDLYSFQPVIIDFGLATFVDQQEYIYYRCGTAGFVSPQVVASSKSNKIGPQSDIFSVGAIFHYLLTSKPLFQGQTIEQVFIKNKNCKIDFHGDQYKDIDSDAMNLLSRMLEIDRNKRIKVDEALNHQFLTYNPDKFSPDSTAICDDDREMQQRLNF